MNMELTVEFAETMKDEKNIGKHFICCKDMIVKALSQNQEDYDTAVTLFTMCLNKCLTETNKSLLKYSGEGIRIFAERVNSSAENLKKDVENFIRNDLADAVRNKDCSVFTEYISFISESVFYAFDKRNSFNKPKADYKPYDSYEQWDYSEKLRDHLLKELTPELKQSKYPHLTEFTEKYEIQIPYLYGWVYDYPVFLDPSYEMKSGKSDDLNNISKIADNEYEPGNCVETLQQRIAMEGSKCSQLLKISGLSGQFHEFLPTIELDTYNNTYDMKKDPEKMYSAVPLIPYYCNKNGKKESEGIFKYLSVASLVYGSESKRRKAEEEKRRIAEEDAKYRTHILQTVMHNIKHFIYPSIVWDVAGNIKETSPENSLKLMTAYRDAQNIERIMNYARLQINANSPQEMREIFREGICPSSFGIGYSVYDIINHALINSVSQFISDISYDDEILAQGKKAVSEWLDIEELNKKYLRDICGENVGNIDLIQWFSKELYPLRIIKNSELWGKTNFIKAGSAYSHMLDIFINVFNNAINHGKKSRDSFLELCFDQTAEALAIKATNPSGKGTEYITGYKKGLSNIDYALRRLNFGLSDEKGTEIEENGETFSVTFFFSNNLIITEED